MLVRFGYVSWTEERSRRANRDVGYCKELPCGARLRLKYCCPSQSVGLRNDSHKLSRITKVCYLAAAVAILALTSTVVAAEVQQSFASSEPTTIQTATSTKTISMINLNFLNASEAKQYNIHGLVTIGS